MYQNCIKSSNCIKSVINQNIGKINYEIIVVNDGSKDKTLNICKNFNKEKALLRIINNKKNYGVSYSRNLAIRQASGKYIIFIDSDDSLKFNSLKRLVGLLKNSDVDVLMALDLKNVERKHKIGDLERNLFIKEKKLVAFFKLLNTTGRNFGFKPWNFIVSRKFLMKNRIYFKQKIKIFEDQLFASQILCCINKIKIYKGSFHIHKERFGSLNKLMSFAAMESCLQTMNELCKLLKNKSGRKSRTVIIWYNRIRK